MGTQATIAVQLDTHWYMAVSVHWDGYLSHTGRMLNTHYNTYANALRLVAQGCLSQVNPRCDAPQGHTFDKPVDGHCIYYGRDRHPSEPFPPGYGVTAQAAVEQAIFGGRTSYEYVMGLDEVWRVYLQRADNCILLADALAEDKQQA
jgi:hypothetical protein